MIHGWNADAEHVALETVRNSYLKLNTSHVLMADWRDIANMRYFTARGLIAPVGRRICKLLKVFVEHAKISHEGIHVVGHSLGAHVGTHIGRCFNRSIGRYRRPKISIIIKANPNLNFNQKLNCYLSE